MTGNEALNNLIAGKKRYLEGLTIWIQGKSSYFNKKGKREGLGGGRPSRGWNA